MYFDCLIIDDELEVATSTCEYFNLFGVTSHSVLNAEDAQNIGVHTGDGLI